MGSERVSQRLVPTTFEARSMVLFRLWFSWLKTQVLVRSRLMRSATCRGGIGKSGGWLQPTQKPQPLNGATKEPEPQVALPTVAWVDG